MTDKSIIVQAVTTTGVKTSMPTYLHMLEWHPSAGGQSLLVIDNDSNVLFKVQSAGSATNGETQYVEWKEFEGIVKGINVSTIGGGTLYIHKG